MAIKNDNKQIVSRKNQKHFGSDLIAFALGELEIPYACLNPGASYRGLHDSIVNFLGILSLFIKENNENNIEIGKNKTIQIENFELSQNFGFFSFIYIYLLISF